MGYLQSILLKDEKMIMEWKLSKWIFLIPLIITFVVLIVYIIKIFVSSSVGASLFLMLLILIFLIVFINRLIKRYTTEIVLTNRRFIRKSWLLSRKVVELKYEKIEGASIEQWILGKMLDYWTLTVTWTGNTMYYIAWLNNPSLLKEKLYQHIK